MIKTRRPHDEANARFSRRIVNRCLETNQALLSEDATTEMPLKDRKGECRGAIGMTLQIQSYGSDEIVAKLLPLLREAAQSLRPLL